MTHLAKLSAPAAVDGDDVLNIAVPEGRERLARGEGGDAPGEAHAVGREPCEEQREREHEHGAGERHCNDARVSRGTDSQDMNMCDQGGRRRRTRRIQ